VRVAFRILRKFSLQTLQFESRHTVVFLILFDWRCNLFASDGGHRCHLVGVSMRLGIPALIAFAMATGTAFAATQSTSFVLSATVPGSCTVSASVLPMTATPSLALSCTNPTYSDVQIRAPNGAAVETTITARGGARVETGVDHPSSISNGREISGSSVDSMTVTITY